MAVRIRLRRMGRKKTPHYRVVVTDVASPRDGRFVESLGYYRPLANPARLVIDLERVDYWIGEGAAASDTVRSLITKARKGGDALVAVGEVDGGAEKVKRAEALAKRRKAEADATAATKPKAGAKRGKAAAEEAPPAAESPESPAAEAAAPAPEGGSAEG
jgi:small subunit ribosomal protein S16